MRKLASIQEIREVIPHENADTLEIVKVNGWQCVSRIGEFKQGDLGVYFEIDSFLPASDERYDFLEKQFRNFEGNEGARIKTIRLRGELSQGMMLPLSIYPEITEAEIGTDVTELLGVIKFEKPLPISEDAKAFFPSFIEKTDQERVQNLPTLKRDGEWERTEKLDGTSLTIYLYDNEFGVCSHNLELIETENSAMWMIARRMRLEERLRSLNRNLAVQGELMGPKIQSNRYKITEYTFFVFDVYDIDNKRKLLPEERKVVIAELDEGSEYKIVEAPFLGYVTLPEGDDWMEKLLEMADGQSVLFNGTIREGDVYKHKTRNESFKVISNKYLIKWDE